MSILVRPARSDEAASISRVIIASLHKVNAKDYSEAVIARVEKGFSPAAVSNFLTRRLVFVAVHLGSIVGTASLDGNVVRAVFVDPEYLGRGIGRALMVEVQRAALENSVTVLTVPASVTAEAFYAKRGDV